MLFWKIIFCEILHARISCPNLLWKVKYLHTSFDLRRKCYFGALEFDFRFIATNQSFPS
ncbi:unnamed protein product [Brugia pahangi]|uniref:Uncharacterized protein n=1 Tax=Brugia pahangi TaxID=6280 RepID=A0A158PQQ1_BRUPA|nr:unnamed protein product [Brugia pahangi]